MGEREVVTGENFNPLAKKRIADLEAQLAACREALEFYATNERVQGGGWAADDDGVRARAALAQPGESDD